MLGELVAVENVVMENCADRNLKNGTRQNKTDAVTTRH